MNSRSLLLFLISALLFTLPAYPENTETALQSALEKANSGNSQAAIQQLESLVGKGVQDARVFQSLGLLYQSAGNYAQATATLERAVVLEPLSESYYALGLLYEAQWLNNKSDFDRQKALSAWDAFLRVASSDHPRRSVGEKHVEKLQTNP